MGQKRLGFFQAPPLHRGRVVSCAIGSKARAWDGGGGGGGGGHRPDGGTGAQSRCVCVGGGASWCWGVLAASAFAMLHIPPSPLGSPPKRTMHQGIPRHATACATTHRDAHPKSSLHSALRNEQHNKPHVLVLVLSACALLTPGARMDCIPRVKPGQPKLTRFDPGNTQTGSNARRYALHAASKSTN
jgi:hypothetical protein